MADNFKVPGVYPIEKRVFGKTVVSKVTAVPVFIGYTQKKPEKKPDDPKRINSVEEYFKEFGGGYYTVPNTTVVDKTFKKKFFLFESIKLFYENGGQTCYVVSVGNYNEAGTPPNVETLTNGIKKIFEIQQANLVLVPDAAGLGDEGRNKVYGELLKQCSSKNDFRAFINQFAILDAKKGLEQQEKETALQGLDGELLAHGAMYHPWVKTNLLTREDVERSLLEGNDLDWDLKDKKLINFALAGTVKTANDDVTNKEKAVETVKGDVTNKEKAVETAKGDVTNKEKAVETANDDVTEAGEDQNKKRKATAKLTAAKTELEAAKEALATAETELEAVKQALAKAKTELEAVKQALAKAKTELEAELKEKEFLQRSWSSKAHFLRRDKDLNWDAKIKKIVEENNSLPPGGAVAGAFVRSDELFGIQKAPANIALSGIKELLSPVNDTNQGQFNVPDDGKSINCIRAFINNDIKIWGARTLDGNDDDFCYVNVRRTMSMLQDSIKSLLEQFVFDDNNERTWLKIRAALGKFLRGMLYRGVLYGNTPSEAYEFAVGLGQTMTEDDMLKGIIRVHVKMALIRPAEFIVVTFEQKTMEGATAVASNGAASDN